MRTRYIITTEDVLTVECKTLPGNSYDGEKLQVDIYNDSKQIVDRFVIGFVRTLLKTDFNMVYTELHPEEKKCLFAVRASRILGHAEEDKEKVITVAKGNFAGLINTNASDDEVEQKLIPLVHRFFKKYSSMESISVKDLLMSTEFNLYRIITRLEYFKTRGFIRSASLERGVYELAPGGMDRLESEITASSRELKIENRYFKLVNISIDMSRPFVFVLMPFKKSEFDQNHYTDVIKPTIEKELKLKCIRSDEITDPGVINDQIYTGIAKARLVIAEVTTQNPNVFYELGLAHALDKSVFIFKRKDGEKLPFDISSVRAINYKGEDDLRQKLISNISKHINDK